MEEAKIDVEVDELRFVFSFLFSELHGSLYVVLRNSGMAGSSGAWASSTMCGPRSSATARAQLTLRPSCIYHLRGIFQSGLL